MLMPDNAFSRVKLEGEFNEKKKREKMRTKERGVPQKNTGSRKKKKGRKEKESGARGPRVRSG